VETQRLLDSDLLVVHFPIWWLGMPAILNGWMDRVFMYGKMYRSVMRREKDDRLTNFVFSTGLIDVSACPEDMNLSGYKLRELSGD